ncbi:MAG: peptidylprolyl isomerase [Paludibacteraceae bacterium]|nr:peptidylprolyl isomerase [Paludibacteraceae bacterium]
MKKKFAFLLGFTLLGAAGFSQSAEPVLMTINGEEITKSEFEYVYNKNNSNASVEKKSVDEYIDLFVNFKLKVAEAKAQGLDQTQSFQNEFKSYQDQLAVPYLVNKEFENKLVEEAFERSKKSLNVAHILIGIKDNDSISAQNKIYQIYKSLKEGESFNALARKHSECPSSANGGELGFANVFDMVYEFENAMYSTPPGSFSKPFRTIYGYHIVKVNNEKTNVTRAKLESIFIPSSTMSNNDIETLFNKAKKSSDWLNLTKDLDNVKYENSSNWIGKGVYPPDLESLIFDSWMQGSVRQAHTSIGNFIVREIVSDIDLPIDSTYSHLIEKVKKNDRAKDLTKKSIESLNLKYNSYIVDENLLKPYAEAMKYGIPAERLRREHLSLLNEPICYVNNEVYSQKEFTEFFMKYSQRFFVVKHGGGSKEDKAHFDTTMTDSEFAKSAMEDFIRKLVIQNEYEYIYNNNPVFRNLLNEYKDGLLLFDISQREVWGKSNRNSADLTAFFEANKDKYSFSEPKYRGSIIYCKNEKIKGKAEKLLAKGKSVDEIVKELKEDFKKEESPIFSKTGLFAKGNNEAVDANIFKSAEYKNEKYPFVVLTGSLTNTPENYREVKGPVTADYQNQLEIEWVKSLREKYPVVINQDVLDSIKNK